MPIAIPTPYIPNSNYNSYIAPNPGTQPVPKDAYPMASVPGGGTLFNTGVIVPNYAMDNPILSQSNVSPQTQALNFNAIPPAPSAPPAPQQPSGDGFDMSKYPGWDETAARADYAKTGGPQTSGGGSDPYAQVRGEINSGYDSYFQNLNDQLNQLPGQQNSQNQIIDNSYGQGVNDLNLQKTQGEAQFGAQRGEIAGNQSKNLKSLDENLRNMFMAGNVYLGSRGAGDSSAANQYSYALTKSGNQARGEQMQAATKAYSEVQARETNLKNIVNNEMTKLKTTADNAKLQVGQWFNNAQNQVKSAIASGQLSKSTDLANLSKSILDQAMSQLQKVQDNATAQQNQLITWAENNSKSIGELKTNLQSILSVAPQLAGASQVNGTPSVDAQGNYSLQGLGTGSTTQKKDIFGNLIS